MSRLDRHRTFTMRLTIDERMTADFFGVPIHPYYSTFWLVQHVEYAARQVLIPLLSLDQNAIGAGVEVIHRAPARPGDVVEITVSIDPADITERIVTTPFTASVGERRIAEGTIRQGIVER